MMMYIFSTRAAISASTINLALTSSPTEMIAELILLYGHPTQKKFRSLEISTIGTKAAIHSNRRDSPALGKDFFRASAKARFTSTISFLGLTATRSTRQ